MPIPLETLRNWVVDYQHKAVIERYADIDESREIREFFAKYLYPSVADREGYESRNEFFRKLVGFYKRGKIRKVLGPASIVYAPIIWMADRMKDLPQYLERTVALYDRTNELDARLVAALAECVGCEADLTADAYREAYIASAPCEERCAQVREVVGIGEYVVGLVERGGIVDLILERCPHIPLFTRNAYVRGINESISLVQTGFRAFKRQKGRLQQFKEICREREIAYVEKLYAPAGQIEVAAEVVESAEKS